MRSVTVRTLNVQSAELRGSDLMQAKLTKFRWNNRVVQMEAEDWTLGRLGASEAPLGEASSSAQLR